MTDSGTIRQTDNNYRVFGFFRFLLALSVVFSHSWDLAIPAGEKFFARDIGIGNVGVMIFFVLSGFIISEATDLFYRDRPGHFMANRFLRLMPPYLLALILSVAIHLYLSRSGTMALLDYANPPPGIFSPENLAVNLTAIIPIFNFSNVVSYEGEFYYFVRYSWAVMLEFAYYGSVFVLMSAAMLLPLLPGLRANPKFGQNLIASMYFVIVVSVLGIHLYSEYVRTLHWAFGLIPYFLLGAMLYYGLAYRRALHFAGVAVSLVLVLLHFSRYTQGQVDLNRTWLDALATPVVWVPLLSTGILVLLVPVLAGLRVSPVMKRADRWFGDLSYPLYLNQYAVQIAFLNLAEEEGVLRQAAAILTACIAAYLAKLFVESPLRVLRDRIRGGPIA